MAGFNHADRFGLGEDDRLRLAAKLLDAGREADTAARESPPHALPALKTIADSARDGQLKLRAIQTREGA